MHRRTRCNVTRIGGCGIRVVHIGYLCVSAQVVSYVEEVVSGARAGDAATGRDLLSLVHSVPHLSADAFADAFASGVKDLLMVSTVLLLQERWVSCCQKR